MISRILVPTDFSDPSRAALAHAEALARLTHAELHILLVRDEFPFIANDGSGVVPAKLLGQHAAERELVRVLTAESVQRGVVARGTMVLGAAAQQILRTAEDEHVDLIVMGTHGRHGLRHMLLGSVAESVIRSASVPVMVVPSSRNASKASAQHVASHDNWLELPALSDESPESNLPS